MNFKFNSISNFYVGLEEIMDEEMINLAWEIMPAFCYIIQFWIHFTYVIL